MLSGLPARVVFVCTLIFGVSVGHAQRRPVAVVDLTGDPATAKLAADLNPILIGHPELRPIEDPSIPPELYGTFRDDDRDRIEEARASKRSAEEELGRYSFLVAEQSVNHGHRSLDQVVPVGPALEIYAQLSFIRGQALLGIPSRDAEARVAFALVHRLDPAFAPDPARYLPDVVQSFHVAKTYWTGKGTLAVIGTGRLWIDGREVGTAPVEIPVDAGPHVVWLTGPDRVTSAKQVIVGAGKLTKLEIADAPASPALKVRRARAALRYAPDPSARAAAMRVLADLVVVNDAVLLTSANGKVVVQTWTRARTSAPGFSALRELKKETPLDLLAPLSPPKPPPKDDAVAKPLEPLPDEPRWYQRRPVQASVVLGVVAAVIGGYYLYQSMQYDTVRWPNGVDPQQARTR